MYILIINGKAYYMAPLPNAGESLNKSYFDSVLSFENYKNCTAVETSNTTMTMTQNGITAKIINNVTVTTKMTETALYQTLKMEMYAYQGDTKMDETVVTTYTYIEGGTGEVKEQYESKDGITWTHTGSQTNMEYSDLLTICNYDYSYLEKTGTGYKIQDEYMADYIENALKDAAATEVADCTAHLYYYVSNGVTVRARGDISCKIPAYNNAPMTVVSDADVTDFGKTKIDRPNI